MVALPQTMYVHPHDFAETIHWVGREAFGLSFNDLTARYWDAPNMSDF